MTAQFSRRRFMQGALAGGAVAGIGDFQFLSQLQPLSAAETKLPTGSVQFRPEIEPLVRLLEETPRDHLLEEVAARIRGGLSYRDVLARLLLAGIRNVQPRPVGFKFHAVLVVNSAHLASMQSPERASLAADLLGARSLQGMRRPRSSSKAIGSMPAGRRGEGAGEPKAGRRSSRRWTLGTKPAADAAVAALARTAGVERDFRNAVPLRLPRFPRHRPQGDLRRQQLAGARTHRPSNMPSRCSARWPMRCSMHEETIRTDARRARRSAVETQPRTGEKDSRRLAGTASRRAATAEMLAALRRAQR